MENQKTWGRLEYAVHKAWHGTQLYIPGETQADLIVRVCRSRGALLLTNEEVPLAVQVVEEAINQHKSDIHHNVVGRSFEMTVAEALRNAGLAKKDPPRCLYSHFLTQK